MSNLYSRLWDQLALSNLPQDDVKHQPNHIQAINSNINTGGTNQSTAERIIVPILLPLGLILPLIVIGLIQMCGHLPHLTLTEIVQGVVGEMTSIVLWGRTGREGCRKLQLWLGGYLLLLYTGLLVLANTRTNDIPLELSAILLASGWIGYDLFIYQVYLFNRFNMDWRKKVHLMGSTLEGH